MTEALVAQVAGEVLGAHDRRGGWAGGGPGTAVAAADASRRDRAVHRHRHRKPPRPRSAAGRDESSRHGGRAGARHGVGELVDELLSKQVEPKLADRRSSSTIRPSFHPSRDRIAPRTGLAERFEGFVGGIEIANAFSELNDPDEQRAGSSSRDGRQTAGDDEAQPFDEDFLDALEQGMPPTGGARYRHRFGWLMILSGRRSIREVVLFPALRER